MGFVEEGGEVEVVLYDGLLLGVGWGGGEVGEWDEYFVGDGGGG